MKMLNKNDSKLFTVDDANTGCRLDRFCSAALTDVSRERIKRAIQQGHCRVDGAVITSPNTRLMQGQAVEIDIVQAQNHLTPEDGDITALWHDDAILILNKTAGITTHPCPSCPTGTLAQRIAAHFPQLLTQDGLRPGIVHRLDKDTSGLLLVALSEGARLTLTQAFAERAVDKEYLALVRGVPPATGACQAPLGRDPQSKVKMAVLPEKHPAAKPAHTEWRVLYTDPRRRFVLLRLCIHTGRTHQIRVHLAHSGHPIIGDTTYGPRDNYYGVNVPRQMLHAFSLGFTHPVTGAPMHFTCPPPQDFLDTALALSQDTQRVVITGLPGCGKSSLLQAFAALGVPTWSADAVIDRLYATGCDGWTFLRGRFGERFAPDTAPVNRTALRRAMHEDAHIRREVEETIHAMTRHALDAFWSACESALNPLAVAEIPLYCEAGWRDKGTDTLLLGVSCMHTVRHARLMRERGWSEEHCHTLDAWQWPEERKMAACAVVVKNTKDIDALNNAASAVLHTLAARCETQTATLAKHLTALWNV